MVFRSLAKTASSYKTMRLLALCNILLQESRAVAGNPRDAAVIFDP